MTEVWALTRAQALPTSLDKCSCPNMLHELLLAKQAHPYTPNMSSGLALLSFLNRNMQFNTLMYCIHF